MNAHGNDSPIATAFIDNQCEQDKRLNHFTGSPPSPPPSSECGERTDGHDVHMNGNAGVPARNEYTTLHLNGPCVRHNCNSENAAATVTTSVNAITTTTTAVAATAAAAATNACHNGPSVNDQVKRRVHLSMQHTRDLSNAPLALPLVRPMAQMTHTSNDGQEASRLNRSSDTSVARLCPLSSPLCHYNVSNSPNRPIVHLSSVNSTIDARGDTSYTARHLQTQTNEAHLPVGRSNLLVTNTHSHVNAPLSASVGHINSHAHSLPHLHSFNPSNHQSHFHGHHHSINLEDQLADPPQLIHHHHHHSHHNHQSTGIPHHHHHQVSQAQQQSSYLVSLNNHLQSPVYVTHSNDDERIGHSVTSNNDTPHHEHTVHVAPLNDSSVVSEGQENLHPITGMTSHLSSCLSSSTSSSMDRCKMCFQCVYNMPGHLMNQHSVAFEALDYFLDL